MVKVVSQSFIANKIDNFYKAYFTISVKLNLNWKLNVKVNADNVHSCGICRVPVQYKNNKIIIKIYIVETILKGNNKSRTVILAS